MNLGLKPREVYDGIVMLGLLLLSGSMGFFMVVGILTVGRWVWRIF